MFFSIMVYMYISIYSWITSLYSGNEHNIVNQQYFYKINFLKNKHMIWFLKYVWKVYFSKYLRKWKRAEKNLLKNVGNTGQE